MTKEIAVYTGAGQFTVSLDEPGTITVYRKSPQGWEALRSREMCLDKTKGMAGLRKSMEEMIEFLGKSTIFVADKIAGIPYFALEKAGYTVWEFSGKPPGFLDYIVYKEEEESMAQAQAKDERIEPQDRGEGSFSINMIEIQNTNNGITSKQLLRPFLHKGEFFELEVICHHVPPWLEAELTVSGYNIDVQKCHAGVRALIRKNTCSE